MHAGKQMRSCIDTVILIGFLFLESYWLCPVASAQVV
ncbi:hypothetical protein Gotur_029220 [Gossypium turneri]